MSDERKYRKYLDPALITAPVGIGAGFSVSSFLRQYGSDLSQPFNSLPARKQFQTLTKVVNAFSIPHVPQIRSWQVRSLNRLAQDTVLTKEDVLQAVKRQVGLSDPTGRLSGTIERALRNATTGAQAIEDLRGFIAGSDSIFVQRAGSSIIEDLAIMTEQAKRGLPTQATSLLGRVPRSFTNLSLSQLDPISRASVLQLAEGLGATVHLREVARGDLPGAELHVTLSDSEKFKGRLRLRVPRVLPDQPTIITRGTTQQSRYIAGEYAIVESGRIKSTINHEQYTLRRAAEELVPAISSARQKGRRAIRSIVSTFEQKIMESPEWIPSVMSGKHIGLEEYMKWRSPVLHLVTPTGDPISEIEHYNIMARGGLLTDEGLMPVYPGWSPSQIARSTVSKTDIRQAFYTIPEAAPWGRRPGQWLRPAAMPTEAAAAAIAADPFNQMFAPFAASAGVPSPMIPTAFVSPQYYHQLSGMGVSPEGQYLLSSRLTPQRQMQVWKQLDISSNYIYGLGQAIDTTSGTHWEITSQLEPGTVLGLSPEGKPVRLPSGMQMLHATAFEQDRAKGNFIRVMGLQTIEDTTIAKMFGFKGMTRTVSPDYISSTLRELGMDKKDKQFYRAVDALMTMDELKKNRGLHYNQMFTALWDYTRANMESGKTTSALASNFANDPQKVIASIRAAARDGDKFSHEVALSRIVGLAREANLNPTQMGRVFGAVPEVFGGLEVLGPLGAVESTEIKKGIAYGVSQLFFESRFGPGSGKTATIEPRTFELLGAPHFGSLGPELQSDIAQRMMAAYPEKVLEQGELAAALGSLQDLKGRGGTISAQELWAQVSAKETLPATPTRMRIAGVGDVYIPGTTTISQMMGHRSAAGTIVDSQLSNTYMETIEAAAQYEQKSLLRGDLDKTLARLRTEVATAYRDTVGGAAGLLRNRLPGSMSLTGMLPTKAQAANLPAGVAGVTSSFMEEAIRGMKKLGIYQEDELKAMLETFEAGEDVPGLLGRHPYLSPHSMQAVMYRKVEGDAPIVLINERLQRAIAFRGKIEEREAASFALGARNAFAGNEHALRRLKQIDGEMLGSPLRLSPMVGHAGDVDGDTYSAILVSPRLRESLTTHIQDLNAITMNEEYMLRSQLLKSKATEDTLTIASMTRAAAGDVAKLGIPEGGRLGRLSVGLQGYRAAVLSGAGGLSKEDQMNALGLLEWLEQTPIAGKHIQRGRELEIINLLDDLQEGLDRKSANEIAAAAETVMAHAKMSGKAALDFQGLTLAMEDVGTGEVTMRHIRGIDLPRATQNLVDAKRAMENVSLGGVSAARMRQILVGQADPRSFSESAALLNPEALSASPLGSLFPSAQVSTNAARRMATTALETANKMGAFGKSVIAHAKPLALGAGAALGIAALLSEPPRILPPGARVNPNLSSGSGGNRIGTNIHPDGRMTGQPTARNPVHSMHSARVASNANNGYRINIQANSGESVDINSLTEQLRSAAGQGTRVNSTVRDMRSTLSPQKLSSILND